jgi:predicted transposase YbfD/YdcC
VYQCGCSTCPKKTLKIILEQGNDYLITAKQNQPTLYQALETQSTSTLPNSVKTYNDSRHGRQVLRTIQVFDPPQTLDPAWVGLKSLIRVDRSGTREGKSFHETLFYISSLEGTASEFNQRIRQHWHIENRLHWVKDVVLHEDDHPFGGGYACANMGILRTFALNLFRLNGWDSLTRAIRILAHDLTRLLSFCQRISPALWGGVPGGRSGFDFGSFNFAQGRVWNAFKDTPFQ